MGSIRDRKSVVCSFCKKRKIKCNKETPCSSCVRYKNHNCLYNYEPIVTKNKRDITNTANHIQNDPQEIFDPIDSRNLSLPSGHSNNHSGNNVPGNNATKQGWDLPPHSHQQGSNIQNTIHDSFIQSLNNDMATSLFSGSNKMHPLENSIDLNPMSSTKPPSIPTEQTVPTNWVGQNSIEELPFEPNYFPLLNFNGSSSSGPSNIDQASNGPYSNTNEPSSDYSPKLSILNDSLSTTDLRFLPQHNWNESIKSPLSDFIPSINFHSLDPSMARDYELLLPTVDQSLSGISYNIPRTLGSLQMNLFRNYEFLEIKQFGRSAGAGSCGAGVGGDNDPIQSQDYIGPLSWEGTMKSDYLVNTMYQHGLNNMYNQCCLIHWASGENKHLTQNYIRRFRYEALEKEPILWDATCSNQYLLYGPNLEKSMDLLDLIKSLMVPKTHIKPIIDSFFEVIYPYIPILDQETTTRHISRIFKLTNKSKSPIETPRNISDLKLNISTNEDYNYAAIFLLMARYVEMINILGKRDYLKTGVNGTKPTMMDLGISLECDHILVAKMCIRRSLTSEGTSILTVQLLLLLRGLYRYGLPLGDSCDNGISQLYNSIIYNSCIRLGLHLDPEMNPYLSLKEKHLFRKIWFVIKHIDAFCFDHLSYPVLTSVHHTVAIPHVVKDNKNVNNIDLEKLSIEVFPGLILYEQLYNQMSEMMLNIDRTFRLSKMCELINQFRLLICQDINDHLINRPINEPITGIGTDVWRCIIFKRFLGIQGILLSCLIHFNSFFNKLRDHERSSKLNLIISKIIYLKLLPMISFFLTNDNFKNLTGSFLVLPSISIILNLILAFNMSLLIRVKLILLKLPQDQRKSQNLYFEKLSNFRGLIQRTCQRILEKHFGVLSNYYYRSWKLKRTFIYYIRELENDELFSNIFHQFNNSSTNNETFDKDTFETFGFKDISNIEQLENIISDPLNQSIYKLDIGLSDLNPTNFLDQFTQRLTELCNDDTILKEIKGETKDFEPLVVPNNRLTIKDMNLIFNDVTTPSQILSSFLS